MASVAGLGSGIDLSTVEYVVSFGDAEDVIALLRNLPIFPPAIETAIRVLTSQPSHTIPNITLTRHFLRSLGL